MTLLAEFAPWGRGNCKGELLVNTCVLRWGHAAQTNDSGPNMKRLLRLVTIFVTLCPPLGFCCSCSSIYNRYETLEDGICSREVYTAVVVGATCNCRTETVLDNRFDCRRYAVNGDSYSVETLARLTCSGESNFSPRDILKTCMQAENDLAPGIIVLYT